MQRARDGADIGRQSGSQDAFAGSGQATDRDQARRGGREKSQRRFGISARIPTQRARIFGQVRLGGENLGPNGRAQRQEQGQQRKPFDLARARRRKAKDSD